MSPFRGTHYAQYTGSIRGVQLSRLDTYLDSEWVEEDEQGGVGLHSGPTPLGEDAATRKLLVKVLSSTTALDCRIVERRDGTSSSILLGGRRGVREREPRSLAARCAGVSSNAPQTWNTRATCQMFKCGCTTAGSPAPQARAT